MRRLCFLLSLELLVICDVCRPAEIAQSSIITTFAGASLTFQGDGGPALNASISAFQQLSTDRSGNILFADTGNHVVSRLNADGTITVLAGNGISGFSGDGGPARSASLSFPSDAVMDSAGNLYIYDSVNLRIRRVTPDGVISTYAGIGLSGSTGDNGPANQARIQPNGKMTVDAAGTLYFTDPVNHLVRRITPDGTVATYAGNGKGTHSGENVQATQASLALSQGALAIDGAGNLYISEDLSNQIRKVAADGTITTLAGSGTAGSKDGPALSAQFYTPYGLALDGSGNLFVADVSNGLIRKISANGVVSTVAGSPIFGLSGDGGPALGASFRFAYGIAIGRNGNLYLDDNGNFRVRMISGDGTIRTVAGNGQFRNTPDGTPASKGFISGPNFLSFDPSGRLLVAGSGDSTVRRINTDGSFQTIAGFGVQGVGLGQGDIYQLQYGGPATNTLLDTPRQAVADAQGNTYISDDSAGVVYRITPDGILNVFAGQVGVYKFGGDNIPATSSALVGPQGLALDGSGNLYIADPGNNRIRKVSPDGIITTFAGTGRAGFDGDSGPASQALLSFPQAIAFDPRGNLIIADRSNNRLRIVTADGNIATIAGDGTRASTGNGGPALTASLNRPFALAVDSTGNIYFLEFGGVQVRRISASGVISVVAGNGQSGFTGDGGPATLAAFGGADGLAVDANGNLYISDFNNDRVRVVLTTLPTVNTSPGSLSFLGTSGGVPSDPQPIAVSSSLAGLQVTAQSDSPWLKVPAGIAFAPGNIPVSTDPAKLDPGTYRGTVTLQSPGQAMALSTVNVTIRVNSGIDQKLTTDASALTFSLTSGGSPQRQSIQVLNAGGGQVTFHVLISGKASPGITASVQDGLVQPNLPATIAITADPALLPVGTNTASVQIVSAIGQLVTVAVTVTVAPSPQRIALSQRGFTFTAVQGGGVTPPQTFAVVNLGPGTFSWSAKASTLSGSGWLAITPNSGSSSATSFGSVTASVNPAGLDPGVYYGLILISSDGAANSPQEVEVVLNLLAPEDSPGAVVGPSGLVFSAPAAGTDPSSQTFQITNLNPDDVPFALKAVPIGGEWLIAAPDNGTIPAASSITITVQPKVGKLAAGVYNGSIAMQIGSIPRAVNVVFVVVPSAASGTSAARTAAACTPAKLYPVFTSFLQDFVIPASWPIPLEVKVVDDCGNPLTSGRVSVNFSNGDPQLSLLSLNDGRWQGTWFGRNVRPAQITVTTNADQDSPKLHGSLPYTGFLQSNPDVPSVNPGGVTASVPSAQVLVAPGTLISISGKAFAAGKSSASHLPLTTDLSGTGVLLAGRSLPIIFSSAGLISAVIPYDLPVDSQYQLIVGRGDAVSGPETVTLAAAQPSVFRIDSTGSPNVAANIFNDLTSGTPIDKASIPPASPVKTGDKLVIYCTGLGAVDQPLDPAMPAPSTSVNTKNPVTVTIGGQTAAVSFAGLVPGYTGLYQVNTTVPNTVAVGDNVPIVVSVLGQSSTPIGVSVR